MRQKSLSFFGQHFGVWADGPEDSAHVIKGVYALGLVQAFDNSGRRGWEAFCY